MTFRFLQVWCECWLARWAGRFTGLGVVGAIAAAGLVAPAPVGAATQAQPHPWAVRAAEAAALGSVSGKAPAVKGIEQGKVTLSNRGFVYTAPFAADGAFRFASVEAGTYALTTEIPGYNLTKTVSVEVAAGAAVSVPDLAIETYTAANNAYRRQEGVRLCRLPFRDDCSRRYRLRTLMAAILGKPQTGM